MLPWRDAVLARRLRDGWLLHPLVSTLAGHTTLRMLAIDDCVRTAVAAGTDQVVLVGAGLDTRAWRLDELAGTRVIELDLPGTQEAKQLRLAGARARAAQVRFVAVDLHRADLDWILTDVGHDPTRPTLWIWEGVSMYVPLPSVRATAEVLAGRSTPGSRLAVTFVVEDVLGPGGLGRTLAPGARALFDLLGEPLRTRLDPGEMTALLTSAGFDEVEITDSAAWASAAGLDPPRDLLGAERLAVARRG